MEQEGHCFHSIAKLVKPSEKREGRDREGADGGREKSGINER